MSGTENTTAKATSSTTTKNITTDQMELADDWSNIDREKLVRGSTPEGIEQRCLDLVRSYLSGSWANLTLEDVTVKRIAGGFTNQMYRVSLKESVQKLPNPIYGEDEPETVAVKLYQAKHIKNYHEGDPERLNDTIILNVMSQKGFGPKVYGIFEGGFIQDFLTHEQFRAAHMDQPALRKQLMELLAAINLLQIPIRKDRDLMMKRTRGFITRGYEQCEVRKLAEELNLKYLKEEDVFVEYDEVMSKIEALKAPLVFVHNDFRGSNLLVVKNDTGHQIFACDLEHGGYGTRGFDLGSIYCEWNKKDIMDMAFTPPEDSVMEELVGFYIEACERLVPGYASKEGNSVEQHLKEARVMVLANKLFFTSFMMQFTESIVPDIPFDHKKHMVFVEMLFADYFKTKQVFLEKGQI